jgi:polar amino acid transport system permease protein
MLDSFRAQGFYRWLLLLVLAVILIVGQLLAFTSDILSADLLGSIVIAVRILIVAGVLVLAAANIVQIARSALDMLHDRWWLLELAVILLVGTLVILRPDPFRRIVVFLNDGIVITISITLISFVLILIVGLIGGMSRLAKNFLIKGAASIYVEVIRGIPLLVLLLFLYFAFPQLLDTFGAMIQSIPPTIGHWFPVAPAISQVFLDAGQWFIDLRPDPFWTAVAGITLCYGAYMTEIFRAGIQAISKGQMEAARSLGMSYAQAMRYVILPQAVRVILPPVGNEFVTLLKDSSLVSVVAVADMTRRGREFMASTYMSLETWFMVALLYLIMTLFAARVVSYIEKRSVYVR